MAPLRQDTGGSGAAPLAPGYGAAQQQQATDAANGQPPAASLALQQEEDQANQRAEAGVGGSGGDLYGLGAWRDQLVDPSGLPSALLAAFAAAGVPLDTSQPLTAAQLTQILAGIKNPGIVTNLQTMLFYAGAYGSSVTSPADLRLGTFTDQDVKALTKVVTAAGQSGSAFGTYLTAQANYGKASGVLGRIAAKMAPIASTPDVDQENAALRQQAQTLFGHDPTPDEYARFRAYFDKKVTDAAQAAAQAQTPPTPNGLPSAFQYGQALTTVGATPPTQFTAPLPTGIDDGNILNRQRLTTPAYTQFQQQVADAQNTVDAVNQAGQNADTQPVTTIAGNPDLSSSAEAFLRQDNPGAVAAQNVAGKYRTLLSIVGGS